MGNFNKVFLLGNLTRDPEVKSLPTGQTVTALGLAVNRTYTVGGPGGEKREETTFVDIDYWARKGEVVAQYFKKGDPIFVEGRLNFRSWEDKDGNKRSKLSVTGENFEFVSGRQGGNSAAPPSAPDESAGMPEPAGGDGGGFDEVPF
ncbi:MAG: single-stranded DNA-binding protein [Planctomycetota bacterium]|nr:single-stranded DNA-binding protein [Planctomycetota bacterium]